MDRRHFVKAGISSVLLPGAILATPAAAVGTSGPRWPTLEYFFFDDRFAEAALQAEVISPGTASGIELIPVQADVTPIWTGLLASGRAVATPMRGVTTESFYFCLRTLLADKSAVDTRVRRIGRELHQWTIRTNNPDGARS